MQLTERQSTILRAVVREYLRTKRPVGSRAIATGGVVAASPSTVRADLGALERFGLLDHPHTSAGRVPTDRGYRLYVDSLMEAERVPRSAIGAGDGGVAKRSVDVAIRQVTEAIAEATELLALVTVPQHSGTVVRHVELLLLRPDTVVVVCITETGDVTRHLVALTEPADPGLVAWACDYLNEQVAGLSLGQRLLRQRLDAPYLTERERAMLDVVAPAFTELLDEQRLLIGGTSALVGELGSDVQQIVDLIAALDERRRLLEALRRSLGAARGIAVAIGSENTLPALRPLSFVGGTYGLPARPLGLVGVIGPRNMNYPRAIGAVHAAVDSLSDIVGSLYE